jgi:CRP-like cAMP-binding protein
VAAIDDAVGGHPFFASLSKETRLSLVQNLTVEAFRKDRAVVLQDDRADAFYVVFSGDVDVFISDATKPLKEWKKDVLASQVNLLKEKISSFELEERRRLLRERHARECAERDYMAIEALKSAGMEYEHVETVPEYIEENPDVYTLDLPLPERLVGRKVATLSQGAAFGENGLHTSINFRAATVVAASDRVLLLKLSREDVQTDVFDSKEEEDSEEDEPALDCNFEPVNVAPLRRLSLKKSVGPVSVPVKAEEPTPPTTGRRTSLLSMFTPCPREATIHVTLQRRKRRGTVSPVKKLARARALDKALND